MKTRKTMIPLVAAAAAIFISCAQVSAVVCPVNYVDDTSTGQCTRPLAATVTQAATVNIVPSPPCPQCNCYRAEIDKPFAFSIASTITLPKVGEKMTDPGGTEGVFDQTFHNTTKTHEDWHASYTAALADVTYGALERWSATYSSSCWLTAASAQAAATADLAAALQAALDAYAKDFNSDVDKFETQPPNPSYCHIENVGGVNTWRSVNPDWGQAAVNYANAIKVSFSTSTGDCPCPEPASLALIGIALLFGSIHRARRRAGHGARTGRL